MEDEIERAILFLSRTIKDGVSADNALKFTQASLNLANVKVKQLEASQQDK